MSNILSCVPETVLERVPPEPLTLSVEELLQGQRRFLRTPATPADSRTRHTQDATTQNSPISYRQLPQKLLDSVLHVNGHLEGLYELLPKVFLVDGQLVPTFGVFAERQACVLQHVCHEAAGGGLWALEGAGGGPFVGAVLVLVAGEHSLPHF